MTKKLPILFCAVFFLFASVLFAEGTDPGLKVQTEPDQTTVKLGMMFLVNAGVRNTSENTIGFWAPSCSYEKQWVTDQENVEIQAWTCEENEMEEVELDPGDAYEKNIILYVSKQDKSGPLTFRLGFKKMNETGDMTEPIWGDPIAMRVNVPEEAAPAPEASGQEEPAAADSGEPVSAEQTAQN